MIPFYCILGAAGAITAMIIKRLGYAEKYWSLLFTINGGLTGMVRKTIRIRFICRFQFGLLFFLLVDIFRAMK